MLRVDFLTRGMQLISCASDGLVKVWNVKDEDCTTTLDNHEEKVSLAREAKLGLELMRSVAYVGLGVGDREAGKGRRLWRSRFRDYVLGGRDCDGRT